MTKYPEGMTNDEIPNDERSSNDEIRMTQAGSAGVVVMTVGKETVKKTKYLQLQTVEIDEWRMSNNEMREARVGCDGGWSKNGMRDTKYKERTFNIQRSN